MCVQIGLGSVIRVLVQSKGKLEVDGSGGLIDLGYIDIQD